MENDERQLDEEETTTSRPSDEAVSNLDLVTDPQHYHHRPVLSVFLIVYCIPKKVHVQHYMNAVKGCEYRMGPAVVNSTVFHQFFRGGYIEKSTHMNSSGEPLDYVREKNFESIKGSLALRILMVSRLKELESELAAEKLNVKAQHDHKLQIGEMPRCRVG
ncbi:hypothetical protein FRX31_027349 [Thalictrum thalictroides]|uniref:Uncharacterized protein n=1 Tax=Thalictrum thalictroides TaxID=46969 RepID=A0A7J6VDS6_THATH|nr:hypothetical protein FRX31_027349 [Thalictrum thalictroides]